MIYNCALCSYNTNKKYNIKRHHIAKHNTIPFKDKEEIKKEEIKKEEIKKEEIKEEEIKEEEIKEEEIKKEEIKTKNNDEYIYLLQEREFIKTNEPIYKIGKTKQERLKRICNYPNGTKLIIQILCNDCNKYERLLINKFKELFIHKREIGNEYFKGDRYKMIETIYNLIWELDIKNRNENEIKIENKKENEIKIENKNQCSKCKKIIASQYYLQKHILICKGVSNPFECHLCHKILANRSSKSTHLKNCKVKLYLIDDEKPSILINDIIDNNITNIIVFNPNNPNGKSFKTDHINLDFINNLLKIKEEDALSLYTTKILDNPENRCIKKTNMRSTFSEIHVGNNKWNSYYDSDIYPKFINKISNSLYELLVDKYSTNNKLIEFLNYMSSDDDEIKNKINKKHKELIQRIKAIVYNLRNFT